MKWSKRKATIAATATGLLMAFLVFSGCKGASPGTDATVDLSTVLTLSTANCDFGMVEAESGTESLSVGIINNGTEAVTLSQVLLSDSINFSSDDSTLPITLTPGNSITIACQFHPMESGTLETSMEITADGYDFPLETTLTGEGNYPPTIAPGLMVYDDNPDIAGFYKIDGTSNGKPLYRNCVNPKYMLYFFSNTIYERWVIYNSLSVPNYNKASRYQDDSEIYPFPEMVQTWKGEHTSVQADITGPVLSGIDFSNIEPGVSVIKAYYIYCDPENDTEADDPLTWYRCDSRSGEETVIQGITGKEYTVQDDDVNCSLKVEMIPCAETGIADGNRISGPYSPPLHKSI